MASITETDSGPQRGRKPIYKSLFFLVFDAIVAAPTHVHAGAQL